MIKRTGFNIAGTLLTIAGVALILCMVSLLASCHHDPRSIRIDNVGAEGFDIPQELTDSQKQRIVEIILESPEAKEKPPTESIYHISMFWTAFIWDDSGYSYMSSVRFDGWEDDPRYKGIPESARWYPGANLYYGDPQAPTAEWLIEASVDLNAEKIVYINSMPYHAAPLIPPAPREPPPSEEEPETQVPTMPPAPFSSLTPPWPDAEVFYDETTTINVDLWDKFFIGYDYYHNLFAMFDVTYDRYPNSVNLLEEAGESTSEPPEPPGIKGIQWFLFQAIKEGDTQITIKEFTHQSDVVQSQKTFNIHVVQP
jgi:hypothetical protein